MAIDHSLTYKKLRLRNVPHILRLRKIKQVVNDNVSAANASYADVGCSNGYITNIISDLISAESTSGFDHSDNLEEARAAYPDHQFLYIDLNKDNEAATRFDVVTCFETVEHVGNPYSAMDNLLAMTGKGGKLIISVPIEIGPWGLVKYLAKRLLYRYELPLNCTDRTYVAALIRGHDISQFRIPSDGYGSHFGFDYRIVDRHLQDSERVSGFRAWNSFTTRFYVVDV